MKAGKHTKAILITGLVFTLLFTHLPVLYTLFYHNLTGAPTAAGGVINLASSATKSIVLDGEWEFYWNRLIVTDSDRSSQPDILIHVPSFWTEYKISENILPPNGFASYRLRLTGLDDSRSVTVYIPDFGSAYRVFIDGKLTSESGVISKSTSGIFTTPQATLYPVTLSQGEHEIILEIATTRFAGLYMAPVLKEYNSSLQEESNRNSIRLILFGIALFSFLVLIVLYNLSFLEGRRFFWLPLGGFLVLIRIMLTTEFYSFWQQTVFFNLSYETTNPLMVVVTFIFKYLWIYLCQEFLGIAFSKKERLGFLLYYTLLILEYLFIPRGSNRLLTQILPYLSFLLEFYIFFKVYHGKRHLQKYGLLIYCGILLSMSGLILNGYYIGGCIYPNMSLALLVLFTVYTVILSFVYALRTSDLRNEFAVASSRLALARSQIDIQKEYFDALSAQMNEIRSIRHDMRHFLGVLKRLSVEERYEELNRFLTEYTQQAETEPLPVFCENAVANSILGYYFLQAIERGIPFRCTCDIPKQLFISDSDLCVVLGNALENAIEACEKLPLEKIRFVQVEARNITGQLLIKIANSCINPPIEKDDGYRSSKSGAFHGMGLRNMKRVVSACEGFMKTEYTQGVFTLMAAFPNPSKSVPE